MKKVWHYLRLDAFKWTSVLFKNQNSDTEYHSLQYFLVKLNLAVFSVLLLFHQLMCDEIWNREWNLNRVGMH